MATKNLQIIETADGSHTLQIVGTTETYHSVFGAITEAQHNFITNGLLHFKNETGVINILETGFGTGLNALLLLIEATQLKLNICYDGLENEPISIEIAMKLNYIELLKSQLFKANYIQMHSINFNEKVILNNNFSFKKVDESIVNFRKLNHYHLIIFDAFAPDYDNKVWDANVFINMYKSLCSGGKLITYCAKGVVKRNLKNAGFVVSNVGGAPGKREITIASKV